MNLCYHWISETQGLHPPLEGSRNQLGRIHSKTCGPDRKGKFRVWCFLSDTDAFSHMCGIHTLSHTLSLSHTEREGGGSAGHDFDSFQSVQVVCTLWTSSAEVSARQAGGTHDEEVWSHWNLPLANMDKPISAQNPWLWSAKWQGHSPKEGTLLQGNQELADWIWVQGHHCWQDSLPTLKGEKQQN